MLEWCLAHCLALVNVEAVLFKLCAELFMCEISLLVCNSIFLKK